MTARSTTSGLAVLLLLLPAAAARAQVPRPSPSPTPPPAEEEPGVAAAEEPPSSWLLSLGLYGGYDSNVEFLVPDGPSDAWASARATLSHSKRGPRGQISFTLDGAGTRYRDDRDLDRIDATAGLGASYRLSSRSTLIFSGSASHVTTDVSRTLTAAGLQLPRDSTLGFGGGLGLEVQSGERGKVAINMRYDRIDFESPELVDTQSATASLRLSRKQSARSHLSFFYGFLRTYDRQTGFDDHRSALGWTRLFTRRLSFALESGVGYSREPLSTGAVGDRWYYYGTAALNGKIYGSTISLQFRRSVNPAYGLGGNLLSYGAALSASIPLGRRARFSLEGVHTWSEDPSSQAEQFVSDEGSAAFSVRFLRRLGLVLAYGYRRFDPVDGPTVNGHRGSVGLTYTYSRPPARF